MRLSPLLLVALALPLAALAAPQPAAAGRAVDVVDIDYIDRVSGNEITVIPVGTTVTWFFAGSNHQFHSADSSVTVTQGGLNAVRWQSGFKPSYLPDTFSFTFVTAGVFVYDCYFHPNMRGYVVAQ